MAACSSSTLATGKPTPTPPPISPTSGPIEQTAAPGSIEVKITLVEFRIISPVTVFHANKQYKGMLIELEPILPGTTWTTNFTFRATGRYEIACQMGRHYLAGMRLPIRVNK